MRFPGKQGFLRDVQQLFTRAGGDQTRGCSEHLRQRPSRRGCWGGMPGAGFLWEGLRVLAARLAGAVQQPPAAGTAKSTCEPVEAGSI